MDDAVKHVTVTNYTPLVSRERFAEMIGCPLGVVQGWINKGYIPTVPVGKYSLINLELMRKNCLENEFK